MRRVESAHSATLDVASVTLQIMIDASDSRLLHRIEREAMMTERTTTGFESSMRAADFRDPQTLLTNYIEICNNAIGQNRNTRWFRQLQRLGEKYGRSVNMHTVIYERNPGDVVTSAVVRFNPLETELEVLPVGDYEANMRWKASVDYLEDVVLRRPEWYLENPLRLDWSWMKDRARDEMEYRVDMPSLATGLAVGAVAGLLLGWSGKKVADRRNRYLQEEINRLSEYE